MATALSLVNESMTLLGQSRRCSLGSSSFSYISGDSLAVGKNTGSSSRAGMNTGKQQSLVLRTSSVTRMQDSEGVDSSSVSYSVKRVAIAAAAALLLSAPAINVSSAYAADPATNILNSAKQAATESFSKAQKSGAETVGQAASAPREKAPPALSQVDPSAEEASVPRADQTVARADFGGDSAIEASQQEGKGTNGFEKVFATPVRRGIIK